MKRILSLVLTLAMVLSLMAGICISVGAEEYTYMQGASITGTAIPELAVGDTLPALVYSVPAGANYTVTACWLKDGADVAAGAVVEDGHAYKLQMSVVANDGYAFAHDYPLLINGEEQTYVAYFDRGENGFAECRFTKDYSFQQPIDKVEAFYSIPEVGKALGEITIPSGVNYTLLPKWWDPVAAQYIPADTVAAKGGVYAAQIRLFPMVGYEFTEDTEVWINGELVEDAIIDFDIINYWSDKYNFCDPISAVSITHSEPELGKELPVPTVTGDNCEMEYYHWVDPVADEILPADTVVEVGHSYELLVIAKSAAGYRFTEETKVTVNGVQSDAHHLVINDGTVHYYSHGYDFRVELTEVSVTYAEPEVGKAFPKAEVAADAGYTVHTTWYDRYTEDVVAYDTVKDGGKYEMNIEVLPKDGYMFAEEVTLTANGSTVDEDDYDWESGWLDYDIEYSFAKPADKFEVSYELPQIGKEFGTITIPEGVNYTLGEDSGWYDSFTGEKVTGKAEEGKRYEMRAELKLNFGYEVSEDVVVYVNGEKTTNFGSGDTTVYVTRSHSFAEAIAEVDLPAWPELKVGDKLPVIEGTGEHYSYYVEWYGEDAEGNYLEDDTIVDGAAYYATIYAQPKKGYEFTENTKITQDGKSPSGWLYTYYDSIELGTVYNFGVFEVIEKVELTTDIPGYGEKGGEVKIPENAGYAIDEYFWGVSSDDTYEDAKTLSGTYQYGDRVLLVVYMDANDGHMFSPDVVITLNGKEYEPVESNCYQDFIYVLYDLGQIKKPGATPETGDTTPVALLSFLCLSTLAGVSILLSKKRIAR